MGIPISNVTRRVVFAASGTGPYSFTFEILAETDVSVYKDDVLLTLTTDYLVTINANGTGYITLTSTPTGATQIAVVGDRAIERTSDFVTGGDFFANTVNRELDSLTIFAQQNAESVDRALKAPQTDPTTVNMTLPRSTVRANKTLAFDANGNPTTGEVVGDNRGTWAASTSYAKRDIVKDSTNQNIYYANTAHTSSGALPISTNADAAKWDLLVDAVAPGAAQAAAEAAQAAAEAAQTAAETAETNAASSASGASTSASNAATSASNASTSATSAASSASAAGTSASNASTSATNASTSASAAATSASNASSSATAASGSATNAANSASAASTSASNASTSATNAANSATTAGTHATNAANSATASANSATASANSATAAAASAAAAAASFDAFDDIYLGAKASDPTVDNDGDPLSTGDQYFNTSANELRVWNGSSWQAASTVGGTVTSLNVTGATTLSGGTANGVTYLNGSKVLTSGSGLTFDGTSLVAGSSAGAGQNVFRTYTAGGYAALYNGAVTPSGTNYVLAHNALQTYLNGNDFIGFSNAGSEAMRLTSTGLGIGTSSPAGKLSVISGSTSTATNVIVGTVDSRAWAIRAEANDGIGYSLRIGPSFANGYGRHLIFATGDSDTERMRLDSAGNLGLGVTPSAWANGWRGLQNGRGAFAWSGTGPYEATQVSGNAVFTGSGSDSNTASYIATDYATNYRQRAGQHQFFTAPSGTAGNAISFTQAMTLTNDGSLALGATSSLSPASGRIDLTVNGSSSAMLSLGVGGVRKSYVIYDSTDLTIANEATGAIRFLNNGGERARIDPNGYLRMASGTLGIQFNGDTAAANALDDYEEGTWNIIVDYSGSTSGVTYNQRNGYYTKIGNVVTVQGEVQLSSKGTGSGNVRVFLPFQNISTRGGLAVGNTQSITVNNESREFLIEGGTSFFYIRYPTGTGSTLDVTYADIASGFYVVFAGTYRTA